LLAQVGQKLRLGDLELAWISGVLDGLIQLEVRKPVTS